MSVRERLGFVAAFGAAMALGGCGDGEGGTSGDPRGLQQPCDIDSGYDGDDLCIEPPPPEEGFQLHFGPESYDEADVEPYLIQPGEENVECIYLNTPNDTEVWVNEYHGRMRPGTHHMITYVLDEDIPDNDTPTECGFGDVGSTFLLGSQESTVDIAASDAAPEHAGYALRIAPNQQARIELHYINTTSEPILREAWINVGVTPPSEVTKQMSPLFWIAELGKVVEERTTDFMRGDCVVPENAPEDLELVQVTGHFHAHTTRMTAWLTDADRAEPCTMGLMPGEESLEGCTRIYEGYDYTDPGWIRFDSITDNPEPDPDQRVPGSEWDGNLPLEPGQRIDWECRIEAEEDDLPFANGAQDAEMCNIFGVYAPSMGGEPWSCVN
ncbi:MAG: hypothetical protein ACOC97_05700 [Myxococcota bacterium]